MQVKSSFHKYCYLIVHHNSLVLLIWFNLSSYMLHSNYSSITFNNLEINWNYEFFDVAAVKQSPKVDNILKKYKNSMQWKWAITFAFAWLFLHYFPHSYIRTQKLFLLQLSVNNSGHLRSITSYKTNTNTHLYVDDTMYFLQTVWLPPIIL